MAISRGYPVGLRCRCATDTAPLPCIGWCEYRCQRIPDTVYVNPEEYERILAVLNNPAPPTEAILRAAEFLRSLPIPAAPLPNPVSPGAASNTEASTDRILHGGA